MGNYFISSAFSRGVYAVSALLAVSAFFISSLPLESVPWWSFLLSFVFLIVIAISLYYINNSCFMVSSDSFLLTGIYLMLCLSNPAVICFSLYHVVTLLFLWSIYFSVRYLSEEKIKLGFLFMSVMLMSIASLIIPSAVWFIVVFFFMAIFGRPINVLRYLLTFIAAALVPLIYLFSYRYFFTEVDFAGYFTYYWSYLSSVHTVIERFGMVQLFFDGIILIMLIRSFIFVLIHRSENKPATRVLLTYSSLYSLMMLAFTMLYFHSYHTQVQVFAYIPFTIMIFNFLSNSKTQKESRALLLLLIILSLVLRVSYFLN